MKENKKLIITAEHIDFVPSKYVENNNLIGNCIYVFSRKKGKTIRKRKNICAGVVMWSKDTKDYGFATFSRNINLSQKTLEILTAFVKDINQNKIKFDSKKGEFIK